MCSTVEAAIQYQTVRDGHSASGNRIMHTTAEAADMIVIVVNRSVPFLMTAFQPACMAAAARTLKKTLSSIRN